MRILHLLSQTELTGAEVYAQNLIESQIRENHEVYVISDGIHVPIHAKFIPMPISTSHFFQRLRNILRLRKFIQQNKIQVIHCHSRGANRHAFWARCRLPIGIVTTLHGKQHPSFSKKLFDIYGEILIAVCENIRASMKNNFGISESKIRVLRNPISGSAPTLRRNPPTHPRLAILGRSSGPKGERIESFVTCFGPWLDKIDGLEIVIIAPRPERFSASFHIKTRELNLRFPGRIQFLGEIPNLREQLSQYSLCVCSGRIAAEGLHEQVPVLASGEFQSHGLVTPENIDLALASNFGDMGNGLDWEFFSTDSILKDVLKFFTDEARKKQVLEFGLALKTRVASEFNEFWIQKNILEAYKAAIFKRHHPDWIPVLMYHKIPTSELQSQHRIFVTKENFERHLQFFSHRNFSPLTFETLRKFWDLEMDYAQFPKKPLLLTFDDGYKDNLENLQPLLQKYKMKATVFLLANHDILENTWDANTGEPGSSLLTLPEKKKLDPAVFEIGSHGLNHLHLNQVPLEAAKFEMENSRKILEKDLSQKIISFAYPFGSTSQNLPQLALDCGYRFAVNTDQGGLHLADQPMSIFRVNIFPEDGVFELWKKTRPRYRKHFMRTRHR